MQQGDYTKQNKQEVVVESTDGSQKPTLLNGECTWAKRDGTD